MLATWKPHLGELSQADTAVNMHFLQVSNDYVKLSLSVNGISRRDPTVCRADKILLQEGSILLHLPSMQQFLLWCQVPIHSSICSLIQAQTHFKHLQRTWPCAVTETWKWVRHHLLSRGLQSTGRHFYLLTADGSGKAWVRELVQGTRDNGEVIIWGSGRLYDVDAV